MAKGDQIVEIDAEADQFGPTQYIRTASNGSEIPLTPTEINRIRWDSDSEGFVLPAVVIAGSTVVAKPTPQQRQSAKENTGGFQLSPTGQVMKTPPKSETYGDILTGINVNINMSVENRKLLYDKSVEMFHVGTAAGIPMDEIEKDIERFISPASKSPATGFGTIGSSANWRSTNPATMAKAWAGKGDDARPPEEFQPRSANVRTGAFDDWILTPQTKNWFFRNGLVMAQVAIALGAAVAGGAIVSQAIGAGAGVGTGVTDIAAGLAAEEGVANIAAGLVTEGVADIATGLATEAGVGAGVSAGVEGIASGLVSEGVADIAGGLATEGVSNIATNLATEGVTNIASGLVAEGAGASLTTPGVTEAAKALTTKDLLTLGGAIVGGGVSLIASGQAAEASEAATAAQLAAQREANAINVNQFNLVREDLQNALNQGLIDIDTANAAAEGFLKEGFEGARKVLQQTLVGPGGQQLTGLEELNLARGFLQDPSRALELPGVQFQLEQGQKGLENILSKSTGGAVSGDILKAAQEFGQDFASTKLDEALGRLFPFINLGLETRSNIADLGLEEGKTFANLASTLGTNRANLRSAAAARQAANVQGFTPAIAGGAQNIGTIRAGGIVSGANINLNLASELSRIGSSTVEQLIRNRTPTDPSRSSTFSGNVAVR